MDRFQNSPRRLKVLKRIKILSMGDAAVGKSCLIKRYCEQKYVSEYVATIGIDYGVKSYVSRTHEDVKVNFWDIAGDQVFFEIRNEFYKDTHGAFLVFDVTNRQSFNNLPVWISEMKEFTNRSPALVIVGNKIDQARREVSFEEGMTMAASLGAKYYETSALDGTGVQEFFVSLFEDALQNIGMSVNPTPLTKLMGLEGSVERMNADQHFDKQSTEQLVPEISES
ncbi:P-loop containing nucleoside triphosphate hydrolase protein [Gorgonomyces haynaldii]|nr:P-loop containing nucleoside triphosphate hydrolase protein [Gorgonomyces haynaldii]